MGLPLSGDSPWPPPSARNAYIRYAEHAAWYSGTAQELQRFYAGYAGQDRTGFFDPQSTAQPYTSIFRFFKFWARQQPGQVRRNRVHIPLAADIASTSADLLFSDPPRLLIPEAHQTKAAPRSKKVQERLDELVDEDSIHTTLLEAAEVSSALGGVFLRVRWDVEFVDHPMLDAVHPDRSVPEFAWGRLAAVTFWSYLGEDKGNVYRHLERHEAGKIFHGVYKGSQTKLGVLDRLSLFPATKDLAAEINTQLKGLACVYVPNMRPNRQERSSYLGRSDYAGCEDMMDSLDETWTSWMRDIRLGKARLIVPRSYLKNQGPGKAASFDPEEEVWEGLEMPGLDGNKPVEIQNQQFAIRTADHGATAEALIERIVATSGYSAATFGLRGAAAVERTATEVIARESRSIVTRGKKTDYWGPALADILEIMLQVDVLYFSGTASFRPRADFPETVHDSLLDTANAIQLLRTAQAISLETSVALAHPTWDPDEVDGEVAKIQAERLAVSQLSAGNPQPGGKPGATRPGTPPEATAQSDIPPGSPTQIDPPSPQAVPAF